MDENPNTGTNPAMPVNDADDVYSMESPIQLPETPRPKVNTREPAAKTQKAETDFFLQNPFSTIMAVFILTSVICLFALQGSRNLNVGAIFIFGYIAVMVAVYYYAAVFGTIAQYVYRIEVNRWYAMNLVCLAMVLLYIIAACIAPAVIVPYEDMPKAALDAMQLKFRLIMLGVAFVVYSGVFGMFLYDDDREVIGLLKGTILTLLSFLLNLVIIGGIVALTYFFLM